MICTGAYEIPSDLADAVESERRFLRQPGRYNETQALLTEAIDAASDPIVMRYRTIEYAAVRVLRRLRTEMDIISASALPVCWHTRQLYLQRRARTVDLAPSRLHCFAGAFQPPGPNADPAAASGMGLIHTALRELQEETHLAVEPNGAVPMAIFKDAGTGSLELVLLGLDLQPADACKMRSSTEGDILPIGFDELPSVLHRRDEWTIGGRFLMLAWFPLCAARRASPVTFAGSTPMEAFWRALG